MTADSFNSSETTAPSVARVDSATGYGADRHWFSLLPSLVLIGIWGLLWAGVPATLPVQPASWLTFLALLIAPGYLLGELLTWRLKLDALERLALAFPLSMVVLAVPGMYALLGHLQLADLAAGWQTTSALVVAGWVVHLLWQRQPPASDGAWSADQWVLLAIIGGAFAAILPTLTLYKIDGDAYAVGSFAADALAGLPLNASEPLFGTDLGPGVRMAFNQSLPMSYLWSYLSGIDAITLTATASRAMIALWTLLATYTLGKAVGHSLGGTPQTPRRFGLFLVIIQFAIFLAAPFFRGDNVSIFFFERTTADKFMVPMTMLPVVFAFTLHFVSGGDGRAWLAAATAALAVSTIHPLIAAMMALALTAFAGFHWLLHLRSRTAFLRCVAIGGVVVITMLLPVVQLSLSRGEAPLAPSYPQSVEGWPVGHKLVPVVPFVHVSTMDIYGPLPDLAQLDASEAESITNPFLIWRFAVNMERRRLIFFDLDHYISDPNIFYEPPYLLALLMLPLLFWRLRRNLGAQLALSTTAGVLFVMFNPLVTPLLGDLVMPWILWRFVWLFPYALIIALGLYRLLAIVFRAARSPATQSERAPARFAPLTAAIAIALLTTPFALRTLDTMRLRAAFPYYFPTPTALYNTLNRQTEQHGAATVLAEQDLSVTLPAYVAKANVVAHRMPTTSEIFPATQQVEALQRLIDQEKFFRARYLTDESVDILRRTAADYVIAPSGSSLDIQLRLMPRWFEWQQDDQSYTLYRVIERPARTAVIEGNTALAERLWMPAQLHFRTELTEHPDSALAMYGLAEIAYVQGQFSEALNWLNAAMRVAEEPALHYRVGQIYAELGSLEQAAIEFERAHEAAPHIARYSLALGDTCLNLGRMDCAAAQFEAAVANSSQPDEVSRMIALADLWHQRQQPERALALYEHVAGQWPSINYQLMLASAYQEVGRYDRAEAVLTEIQQNHPLSTDAYVLHARVQAEQSQYDEAVALYRQALLRQAIVAQESTETRLELAQVLIDAGRVDEAQTEIDGILRTQPATPLAYSLQGDIFLRNHQPQEATEAYQHGFRLDPTQVSIFVKLTNQLRYQGGQQDDILELLQQAIKANPDEPMLALALGDQLERRGEIDRAVDAYQTALDMLELSTLSNTLNPRVNHVSRAYAFARLSGVSEDQGQLEAAMNYYHAAVAAVPELAWPRLLLGDALRRRGELEDAEVTYTHALSADPEDVDAHMRLADLNQAMGHGERAAAYREQAQELALAQSAQQLAANGRTGLSSNAGPGSGQDNERFAIANASDETLTSGITLAAAGEDAEQLLAELLSPESINLAAETGGDSLRILARIYQSTAGPEKAVAFYKELIAAGEQNGWYASVLAEYYKELGDLYLSDDRVTEAADAYARAVALDDWWPQPRLGLARALADLGQMDAAIEQLQTLVTIAPGYVEAQVSLAAALETTGAGDAALEIYEQTARVHRGNVHATLALAHARQNRGDWERAEGTYRETLEMNGGSADAYVGLATLLNKQSRYAEAQPLLERALEIDAQNVDAYLQRGVIEQHRGNVDRAMDWFNRATEVHVDSPAVSITLIDSLMQAGDYASAQAYIQDRLLLQPDDIELLLRMAAVQRSLGDFSGAMDTLLRAEKRGISDHRLAAALGELYITQGRPREALAAYQQALTLQPSEAEHYLRISNIWRGQGDYARALAVLKQGVEEAAAPAPLYTLMAELYVQLDEQAEALALLEGALAEAADQSGILLALGAIYESTDAERAEAWYDELLESHADDASIHMAAGDFYRQSERVEDAIAAVQRAIELSPQDARQYGVLGQIYAASDESELAIEAYEQALALAPTQIDLYSALANLYAEQGETAKARTAFARGMSIEPTDGRFIMAYAQFLLDGEDRAGAERLLRDAEQLAPTAEMLIARADIHQQLGNAEDAENDLRTALQKEPGSIEAYEALSSFYQEAGNDAQAQLLLERTNARLVGISLPQP